MNFAQGIDFNSLMEPVALRLLGEPAQKHGHASGATVTAARCRSTSRRGTGLITRPTPAAASST